MNMAVEIQANRKPDLARQNGSETVIGRLREYSRHRHDPEVNSFPASPFQKIKEMQGNAGIRGKGIRYDQITTEEDPEVTLCKPDGGLGELAERRAYSLEHHLRTQEMATAIHQLPSLYRGAIEAMYHVSRGERYRTFEAAANKIGRPKGEYQLMMTSAYGWLECRLCMPADRYESGSVD